MPAALIARGDDAVEAELLELTREFLRRSYFESLLPSFRSRGIIGSFNGLADTAADAVSNLIREFALKGITSHVPKGMNRQP
jgi:hypothetical protein